MVLDGDIMNDFTNYFDELRNSSFNEYVSYMNSAYMNLHAPTIKVFKLDKKATVLEPLYGSAEHSKIFLPPFDLKAYHLDNIWKGTLNIEPYQEIEDNIKFVVNFNSMVKTIRDLKYKRNSDIFLNFAGGGVPAAEKTGTLLKLYVDDVVVASYELTDGSVATTQKLNTQINTVLGFSSTMTGVNDPSINLIDFDKTSFKNSQFNFYSLDTTYANITDILEMGDAILTHKYRAYQVLNGNPTGDFGWDYATFTLDCNLYELDELDGLPGSYRREIEKHQWGMRKINKE